MSLENKKPHRRIGVDGKKHLDEFSEDELKEIVRRYIEDRLSFHFIVSHYKVNGLELRAFFKERDILRKPGTQVGKPTSHKSIQEDDSLGLVDPTIEFPYRYKYPGSRRQRS